MRWKTAKALELGHERKRSVFLWLPREWNGVYYWLENVHIQEVVAVRIVPGRRVIEHYWKVVELNFRERVPPH